ncbi:MAG: hypothetical protein HC906_15640 [Bacteroidales bacterium]|nr:hypothetical protein [Bacteroidales bacterium]
MTEIILIILGIGLLLYVLLGGADFGGGILEIITGKKVWALSIRQLPPFGKRTMFG